MGGTVVRSEKGAARTATMRRFVYLRDIREGAEGGPDEAEG